MANRPVSLLEANHHQLMADRPNLAVLPWGATEAHNQHLPYGTDALQAQTFAIAAGELAASRGAKLVVLPTVPFGNNAQQQDQVATIHLSTGTALAILRDVCLSLKRQQLTRLVIVNAHGGNEFKPLIRDLILETGVFIAVANFWQLAAAKINEIFGDPGDHAGILETSLAMLWNSDSVHMEYAGSGERKPFNVPALNSKGVWTPRPWTEIHPDLGSGNPQGASAEKGKAAFEAITAELAQLLLAISTAERLP